MRRRAAAIAGDSTGLDAELAEMVIEVLVGDRSPFLAAEFPEERVHLLTGGLRASLDEDVDDFEQPLAFDIEIALVGNHEGRTGGGVPGERFFADDRRSDERRDDLPEECLFSWRDPGTGLENAVAVREHLRGCHLSPQPRTRRLQISDAREELRAIA